MRALNPRGSDRDEIEFHLFSSVWSVELNWAQFTNEVLNCLSRYIDDTNEAFFAVKQTFKSAILNYYFCSVF